MSFYAEPRPTYCTPPPVELGSDAVMLSLTPQQSAVMDMLDRGKSNKQIAGALGISETTVKAHLSRIFRKLGVHSRTQAIIAAAQVRGEAAGGNRLPSAIEMQGHRLTPRQSLVLSMMCQGYFNKNISSTLGVTEATVKAHISAILRKVGATSRTQAVLWASQRAAGVEGGQL